MMISDPVIWFMKDEEHESNDGYRKLFEEHNYLCTFLPVLTSESCQIDELNTILMTMDASKSNGIILTSKRASEILVNCIQSLDYVPPPFFGFVVGERTGKPLQSLGISYEGSESGNADALAISISRWLQQHNHVYLLYLCGDKRRDVISTMLRTLRQKIPFEFRELMVYRTYPVDPDRLLHHCQEVIERVGKPSVMVFFSPSGVKASDQLLDVLTRHSDIIFAAVGITTQEALRKDLQIRNVHTEVLVAQTPTPIGLWDCITTTRKLETVS
jgi:uroporphyrinogen-III synthase